jgi:hypothetical protein
LNRDAAKHLLRRILCSIGIHRIKYPGGSCEFCPKIDRSGEK